MAVVAFFVIGAIVTGTILFFGLNGAIGGGIPGTVHTTPSGPEPLTKCEGKDAAGSFHFILDVGVGGALRFNGSSPGPCIAVAEGSSVTVTVDVLFGANRSVGWDLISGSGPVVQSPAFAGAGLTGSASTIGIEAGTNATFSFVASTAGEYRYVSEVSDQAAFGVWGAFNVTSGPSALHPPTSGSTNGRLDGIVEMVVARTTELL
jgi:Multicopper oxidase